MLLQENFNSQRVCLEPSDSGQYNIIDYRAYRSGLGNEYCIRPFVHVRGFQSYEKISQSNWLLDHFYYSQISSIATVYVAQIREGHTHTYQWTCTHTIGVQAAVQTSDYVCSITEVYKWVQSSACIVRRVSACIVEFNKQPSFHHATITYQLHSSHF